MNSLYKTLLNVTLEYGQGYCRMVDMEKDDETTNYDCSRGLDEKLIDYHIYKIGYKLKSNEGIQCLQLIFKNRNDGKPATLLDTAPEETDKQYFELEDNEEIIELRIWEKNDALRGLEISTNKGRIQKIGYGEDQPTKIKEFESGDKIIFGFGCHANQKYGVSSIYSYFMNKKKFGIVNNMGLLQLRSKLKKNPEFKTQLEAKKSSLNEKQRLILDICDLPDTSFFPICSYLMSY